MAAGMTNIANLLFAPILAGPAAAAPSGSAARKEIGDMIEALRAELDMDVAFVSRQIGTTHRIFTHVAAHGAAPLAPGDHNPNDNSLCWLVIQGKLPERVNDTSHYAAAACLPITEAINVRAHFSVPLRRCDGRVHGSLCCFSYRPRPDVGEREMEMIRSVAAIVSDQIESRIELEERGEDAAEEIARLILDDALTIIHQPIYDLTDWHLIGHECLMRHKASPDRSPRELLEQARMAGRMLELELHLAAKALATLDPEHPERFIAINVSPETLASPALARLIPEGIASRLVIELNQQDTAADPAAVRAAIEMLKERAWVAVDAAGAGFADLEALVDLRPDIIKIDRAFLTGVAADTAQRALVKALVGFAVEAGVQLIAQGVETREDLQALRELGVRFAQGFILGKPAHRGRQASVC
jgi:EAL domain-containing protein (putative c-di-GMP-specific phosphodiesterase class I)